MGLEINGPMSSGKNTKHIRRKYFFIKDRIDSGDLEVKYCPTEDMWVDVLTKPKQGAPFKKDRSKLMNVSIEYNDDEERGKTHPLLLPKEDVETPNKVTWTQNLVKTLSPAKGRRHRSVLGNVTNGIIRNPKYSRVS